LLSLNGLGVSRFPAKESGILYPESILIYRSIDPPLLPARKDAKEDAGPPFLADDESGEVKGTAASYPSPPPERGGRDERVIRDALRCRE